MIALISIGSIALLLVFLTLFFRSRREWIAKAVGEAWGREIGSWGGSIGTVTPGGLAGPAYRAAFTLDGVEMTLTQTNPPSNQPWNGVEVAVETRVQARPGERLIAIARDRIGPMSRIGSDLAPIASGDPEYDGVFAVFSSGSSLRTPGADARKLHLASPSILIVSSSGALKASVNPYAGNAGDVKNAALILLKIAKG